MKSDDYSQSYLKRISISNIPSDIHWLGLSEQVTDLLIEGGIFFISQIEKMTEYELKQLQGISSISAEKIKRVFYRYRWRTNQNRTIQSIEDLKLLIETSPRKTDILKISIDDLNLPTNAYIAFYHSNIKTIGDLIQLSETEILKIRGIGKKRYNGVVNSILEIVNLYEEGIVGVGKLTPTDPLDDSLYNQSNLTFLEVFTILFNTFKPRDCEIFFEYYLTHRARHGAYKEIADKYDLSRERIRKICEKGLKVLRNPGRKNSITTYLNTVWKEKVQNFVIANEGNVTRLKLEQEFADDLPAIYFIQNKILQIEDIWASVLLMAEQYYYLPN
jgi:hypothetical protein